MDGKIAKSGGKRAFATNWKKRIPTGLKVK
jgi:hypothetical protein